MSVLIYPTVRTLIDRQAEKYGERTFLADPQTGQEVSFERARKDCVAVSRLLLDAGAGKGDRVAFLLNNGLPAAELLLGIAYAGMVAVPLNTQAGAPELVSKLGHCGAKLLFLEQCFLGRISDAQLADMDLTVILADDTVMRGAANDFAGQATMLPLHSNDPAFLVYTSGTTGQPKGVMVSHCNILWGAKNTADAHCLSEKDRSLCAMPLYHMNAQIVTLLSTLWSGGIVVLPSNFTVNSFWAWGSGYACTWFALTPTLISQLLEASKPVRAPSGLEDVRFARSSSAPLALPQYLAFEKHFRLPLIEAMGMTEAGGAIFTNPLPPRVRKTGSIGLPWGFEVKVMDHHGAEVPDGEIGEITVRGPSVMMGYFDDLVATRQVLDTEGWLRTGDMGRKDKDGYFFITGREKDLINRGGEKISPSEIDVALLAHSQVSQAVTFAIPHPTLQEEIASAVVLRDAAHVTERELRHFLLGILGPLKMPRRIWLVDELPFGPTGKPLRKELSALFLNAKSVNKGTADSISETEKKLTEIWSSVLERTEIAPEDDFFMLGGDSLSWTAVIPAIESEFGVVLPLNDFLRHPTIRELSAWLDAAQHGLR
jgi:acyl-CoA synthetase (AMP-forming)/AMP-acid ligase II/acyl carrier protein